MAKIKKIKLPNNSVYDLVDYRIPGVDTEVTSGSNNLITSGAVQNALNSIVVPESMKYKGTVGTGGTITTLPAAATNNSGDTYKVITDGTYQSISAKIGDVFISNGETWTLIPSGDEPSGTVTNIATGTGLTGGPITTTGTISIDTDVVAMKSEIPSAVTESTVAGWGFTKNTGTLTSETDPVFSASAAAGITSTDINNWNNKVSNVQSDWNATSGLAQILNKPTIPTAVTESTVSGWGFTKNAGTITGVGSITSGNVTVDSTPTTNSTNLVTSGGVKSALDGKMNIGGVVSDFNTETTPGNYAIDYTASANKPPISYGQALVLNAATDTVAQLAFNYTSGSAYFRGGSQWGANWNSWREFAFKDDLSNYATTSALSGYLPLTGGTLASNANPILTLNTTSGTESGIKFQRNGTDKGWTGYNDSLGTFLYNNARGKYLSYKDDGSLLFEGNKVWHAGNDGSDSGLDADLLDGLHNGEVSAKIVVGPPSYCTPGSTVADAKTWLANYFDTIGGGVGANATISTSYIQEWTNDAAQYHDSSVYSFIKIGAGYTGTNYGQWLLSSYGTERIGYVGRNQNQWTDIKWIATTEDIPTSLPASDVYSWAKASSKPSYSWNEITGKPSVAIQGEPNNLVHSGNEFTIIPPNFSNNLWFNYRTSDLTQSGNVTGYYFGDGAGNALAYIAAGDMYVNNTRLAKITEIPTSLTTAEIDAIITAEDS